MSNKMLYPFFCIQRQWVICGLNVVRIVPHLRRKHKVHQSTQRVWPCVEALQKDEKSFTISFPLYLHFLSSKMKMVKVLLYYLLQLKEENDFKKHGQGLKDTVHAYFLFQERLLDCYVNDENRSNILPNIEFISMRNFTSRLNTSIFKLQLKSILNIKQINVRLYRHSKNSKRVLILCENNWTNVPDFLYHQPL